MNEASVSAGRRRWWRYLKWAIAVLLILASLAVIWYWPWLKKLISRPTIKNVMIPMTDGIQLATDVYLPDKTDRLTTILLRTPYGKSIELSKIFVLDHDVAFVVQDTRGRGKSQGHFYPFRHERKDGLDTLEWVKKQPWSNGRVIGLGLSYPAIACWSIIDELDATIGVGGCRDCYDLIYPGGLLSLQTCLRWSFLVTGGRKKLSNLKEAKTVYESLPLIKTDDIQHKNIEFWNDWLSHPQRDEYWQKMANKRPMKGPLLSIAGWYDIFLYSQLKDFADLSKKSAKSKMVIGPWAHGPFAANIDVSEGQNVIWALNKMSPFLSSQICEDNRMANQSQYTLFIIHRNQWYECNEWPPEASKVTEFYLAANGTLSLKKPKEETSSSYEYRSDNPMPSFGGTSLGIDVGPAWQNENEGRKDCLMFQTAILNEPMTLLGPLSATLFVKSSAPKTDFILLLQDVYPDGKILNIQEGGCPVLFNDSGAVKGIEVDLWATGYELRKGHRLRLVITSSWFPRFNRNSNTLVKPANVVVFNKAKQHLYFGGQKPSCLHLPLLSN